MGRNKELNELMKDERKQQIFSSALKLFATRGLASTKIADIAQDAGFSQGLVYHYFKSKDDIFIQLIKMAFTQLNSAAKQLEHFDLPHLQKLKIAYESMMDGLVHHEDAALTHLLIATSSASESIPDEARLIIDEQYFFPYEVIRRIIEAGQTDGSIVSKNSRDLALLFWSTIRGLSIYRATHHDTFVVPEVESFLAMFRNKE
ncbi:MAG: TetR/AcrR family transcriptional regulator [Candidatus Marinimicrobia bacterium]|nr:TetR/AcrR family transcriptional regulator [Candidatus Neomarinimicrobiota bacterium]